MRHFIVERMHGHWSAWEALRPELTFAGDGPAVALRRLFDALGLDFTRVTAGSNQRDNRQEFTLPGEACPDCGGTGHYVGLNAVETCKRCDGSGGT